MAPLLDGAIMRFFTGPPARKKMMTILINEAQAAERLALSIHTMRRWRVLGRGPVFLKVGGKAVRYRESDLEAFLSGRLAPTRKGA
jgi:predicted DNA-binding transcriptional regulator AlpA